MDKLYREYLFDWLSQYVDDVTDLEIKKDVIRLFVRGKLVGIITHQKI